MFGKQNDVVGAVCGGLGFYSLFISMCYLRGNPLVTISLLAVITTPCLGTLVAMMIHQYKITKKTKMETSYYEELQELKEAICDAVIHDDYSKLASLSDGVLTTEED